MEVGEGFDVGVVHHEFFQAFYAELFAFYVFYFYHAIGVAEELALRRDAGVAHAQEGQFIEHAETCGACFEEVNSLFIGENRRGMTGIDVGQNIGLGIG